jgi:hypothetical protein
VDQAAYDQIGLGYGEVRQSDPRIAARIEAALGDARTVLNIGAGTGSYEPVDRKVIAVEPSAEMIRVSRERVLVLSFDGPAMAAMWMVRDYIPRLLEIHTELMPPIAELTATLPGARVETVPVPRLCKDGFFCALWDRPEMHLDPQVRRGSSVWHLMAPEETKRGLQALRADLESGTWDQRYGHLRTAPELDVGLRLVVAELDRRT